MASDTDTAQARILAAALEDQIVEMSQRLELLRASIGSYNSSRNLALRREATELFRDITKARFLIDRLHQRYLDAAEATA